MKKVMIALAACCVSVFAEAASVKWNSGTIYIASDAIGTTGSGTSYKANGSARSVSAYFFALTAEEYATASSMETAALYNQYIVGAVSPTLTGKTGALGTINLSQTVADGSTESPQTGYGLVLYVDTTTSANYENVDAFVKSYVGTTTWKDTVGSTLGNLAAQQSNWTAIAIPEPTSGLLLLLGMAGLALRRRRV